MSRGNERRRAPRFYIEGWFMKVFGVRVVEILRVAQNDMNAWGEAPPYGFRMTFAMQVNK